MKVTTTATGETLDVANPRAYLGRRGRWTGHRPWRRARVGDRLPGRAAAAEADGPDLRHARERTGKHLRSQRHRVRSPHYDWTFSDGASAEGASVRHTFANTGDLWAEVDGTDAGGNTGSTTTDLGWVGPPVNTGPPAVTGTLTQGQALTAGQGTWSGNPTSYGY